MCTAKSIRQLRQRLARDQFVFLLLTRIIPLVVPSGLILERIWWYRPGSFLSGLILDRILDRVILDTTSLQPWRRALPGSFPCPALPSCSHFRPSAEGRTLVENNLHDMCAETFPSPSRPCSRCLCHRAQGGRMRGRHGVQYVAQCVACAALTLVVWQ